MIVNSSQPALIVTAATAIVSEPRRKSARRILRIATTDIVTPARLGRYASAISPHAGSGRELNKHVSAGPTALTISADQARSLFGSGAVLRWGGV